VTFLNPAVGIISHPNRCYKGKPPCRTVCRRRLREEVLSGRVAQLEKQAVGVLSRFVVANDMDAEVKRAFILRPHVVDGAAGFVRMDVLSPEDMPNEIWLMTYWADIASYRTWHKSDAYHLTYAQHLNHWGTAEGVNPLGPLEIL